MKTYFMKCLGLTAMLLTAQVMTSCDPDDEFPMKPDKHKPEEPKPDKPDPDKPTDGTCYVHLYDGDNFTDDNIVVKGPGEFRNLKNLPGAKKNWTNEADALKVGPKSTVIVWPRENFRGKPTVFKAGSKVADLDEEPQSMKIKCED